MEGIWPLHGNIHQLLSIDIFRRLGTVGVGYEYGGLEEQVFLTILIDIPLNFKTVSYTHLRAHET